MEMKIQNEKVNAENVFLSWSLSCLHIIADQFGKAAAGQGIGLTATVAHHCNQSNDDNQQEHRGHKTKLVDLGRRHTVKEFLMTPPYKQKKKENKKKVTMEVRLSGGGAR